MFEFACSLLDYISFQQTYMPDACKMWSNLQAERQKVLDVGNGAKRALEQAETIKRQVAEAETEMSHISTETTRLTETMVDLSEQIKQAEIKESRHVIALRDARSKYNKLQESIRCLERQRLELQNEIVENPERILQTLHDLDEDLQRVKNAVKLSESRIPSLEADKVKAAEYQACLQGLEELLIKIEKITVGIRSKASAVQVSQRTIENLKTEINRCQSDLKELSNTSTEKALFNKLAEDKLVKLREKLNSVQEMISQRRCKLDQERTSAMKTIAKITNDSSAIQKRVSVLNLDIDKLKREFDEFETIRETAVAAWEAEIASKLTAVCDNVSVSLERQKELERELGSLLGKEQENNTLQNTSVKEEEIECKIFELDPGCGSGENHQSIYNERAQEISADNREPQKTLRNLLARRDAPTRSHSERIRNEELTHLTKKVMTLNIEDTEDMLPRSEKPLSGPFQQGSRPY